MQTQMPIPLKNYSFEKVSASSISQEESEENCPMKDTRSSLDLLKTTIQRCNCCCAQGKAMHCEWDSEP